MKDLLLNMELREAMIDDLPAITRLYAYHVEHGSGSFEEEAPNQEIMTERWRQLRQANMPYVVACRAGHLLGFAYAGPYRPRSAYRFTVENSIYVDPSAMRQGVGRNLLAETIARATSMGKRQMLAVIGDSSNLSSVRLHESMGFMPVGTFRSIGYKFGRWTDSVLMQRALGDGDHTPPQ